jgi:DNA modification methylase
MMEEVRQKKIKVEIHNDHYTIYNGSMLDMLEVIQPNSIDSIVCDPPYELSFMNKGWDNCGISFNPDTWKKCYEVLKPGGYLLAFGGSRTFHRMAVAIEDAGFEIRDTIMWLYGSGFPKSMDVSKALEAKEKYGKTNTVAKKQVEQSGNGKEYKIKQTNNGVMGEIVETTRKAYIPSTELAKQWQGWGTALKPAYEPVIVARKPFKGSLVDNIIENGVGGINIDECRIPTTYEDIKTIERKTTENKTVNTIVSFNASRLRIQKENYKLGRFPSNIIHDGSEEVISGFPQSKGASSQNNRSNGSIYRGQSLQESSTKLEGYREWYNDDGSASRYFYCAKASKKDRDEGLFDYKEEKTTDGCIRSNQETARKFGANSALRKNIHPTVKPCELMQYLVRLVSPKGATILDPFMGSGSTGKAVMFENRERNANYKFIGIDLEEKYCQIAIARIDYALNKFEYNYIKEKQEAEARGQANIFDFIEVN